VQTSEFIPVCRAVFVARDAETKAIAQLKKSF
jgi:hypothetical protein